MTTTDTESVLWKWTKRLGSIFSIAVAVIVFVNWVLEVVPLRTILFVFSAVLLAFSLYISQVERYSRHRKVVDNQAHLSTLIGVLIRLSYTTLQATKPELAAKHKAALLRTTGQNPEDDAVRSILVSALDEHDSTPSQDQQT